MAQLAEGDIKAGSSRSVGRIRADPGLIWAEGGPLEPRLVITLAIEMFSRPASQMLALLSLAGTLHLGDPNNPTTQVGASATANLLPDFRVRSLPDGASTQTVQLRFQLSPLTVHRLETARHSAAEDSFELHLKLEGPLAWLRTTRGELLPTLGRAGSTSPDDPFDRQLGLHSELSVLWTTGIDTLRIQIDPSVWIRRVLPGLGIDNYRLVEIKFPPGLPDVGNAALVFDEAQRSYDGRRYTECVAKCRAIIRAWNRQLGATTKIHLAQLVGKAQGWPSDDPRRALVDAIWQALLDSTNAANHPESQDDLYQATPQDARLHLMLTAVISDYLYRTLG